MTKRPAVAIAFLSLVAAASACTIQNVGHRPDTTQPQAVRLSGWRADQWTLASLESLPDNPISRSIRRGHALIKNTGDSLPAFVGANLNCTSCHMQEGRRPGAVPLIGVHGTYPTYNSRADAVVPLEDRVNYCFTRSLAGWRLPADSREMQDIIAYIAFLSRGIPVGAQAVPLGLKSIGHLAGDSARGAALFVPSCARCHGSDGEGMGAVPSLWGPQSFSIGASMAREERAASFIKQNMPMDKPGTLTDQDAFDIAAYITSQPRPDMPGKELDWPRGDAPVDVPYKTTGRTVTQTPKLIPRARPADAIVTAPRSVKARR